jgi:DNA-binding response OmpR family regulator
MSSNGPTVLLVEDAHDLGPLLRDTLEEWGRRTLLATDGAKALELLRRETVSLMLLDYELPDMSAQGLLERLRSGRLSIPPVVLMTARTRPAPEGWPELVDVLPKPFELSELAQLLNRHLPP